MQKLISTVAIILLSPSLLAQQLSPQNEVLRPLTNKAGEAQFAVGVSYNDSDRDHSYGLGLDASYGITDNLQIGLDGLTYRLIQRADNATGFEATIGGGLRGYYESGANEALAYGTDLTGKYVFSPDTAMYFNVGYVFWNEKYRDNREEFRYTVGVQRNLIEDVTLSVGYSYRDLRDNFAQDHADAVNARVNYSLNKNWDMGITWQYTDFDAEENAFPTDDYGRRSYGVYAAYRF